MLVGMQVCARRKCSRSNELIELDVQQSDYAVDKHAHVLLYSQRTHVNLTVCPFDKTVSCTMVPGQVARVVLPVMQPNHIAT